MRRKVRILSGLLLLFCGSLCFLLPNIREWKIQREVDQLTDDFGETEDKRESPSDLQNDRENEAGKRTEKATEKKDTDYTGELYTKMQEYNERLAEEGQSIVDAWSYEQPCLDPSVLPDGDYTIGYIEIPDMEVRLPLLLGASRENLAQGAAVLAGTSLPIGGEDTNCVIAAHRGWKGSAYFQYIEKMEQGSLVYIGNPWETLIYRAVDIRVIDPDDVDSILIQEGKDMVTLLTCHPYMSGGKYRYLVYCERSDAEVKNDCMEEQKNTTKAKKANKVQKDERNNQEEGYAAFHPDLIEVERYIRIALPLLTLLLSFLVIYFRYFK